MTSQNNSDIESTVRVDRDMYPDLHSALIAKPKIQRAEFLRALAAEAIAARAASARAAHREIAAGGASALLSAASASKARPLRAQREPTVAGAPPASPAPHEGLLDSGSENAGAG